MRSAGEVAFFCLGTGAALGCLFLLFEGLGALLGLGKIGTAVLDVLFCGVCGVCVFLCALAVDHGRLRLAQIVLQGLGAWAAVAALGPEVKRFRRFGTALRGKWGKWTAHFRGRWAPGKKKPGKTGKKPKKAQKKT